jgi:hypothetical protein
MWNTIFPEVPDIATFAEIFEVLFLLACQVGSKGTLNVPFLILVYLTTTSLLSLVKVLRHRKP